VIGTLREEDVVSGVARPPRGLFQRRVRMRVFGEPAFEAELVPADLHPARPHVIAFDAWRRLRIAVEAELGAGLAALIDIHSAYRSVALQAEVWAYRLDERRRLRAEAGLPELSQEALERLQMKWTAKPGTSAHHTGLALDLAIYELGKRGSLASPAYAWLARRARDFGFYPYLPEGWHWEYNPPGLVAQLLALRQRLQEGAAAGELGLAPALIPRAMPAVVPRPR